MSAVAEMDLSVSKTAVETRPGGPARLLRIVPIALAIFFALWSLRGVSHNNILDTDGSRHAMNGAFLLDLVKHGRVAHPIEYGKEYYGRLPALSMPYHPPFFPAMEAAVFAVFGVNVLAVRILVAIAVGVSVFLFYRLIVQVTASHLVAVCATLTFLLWKHSQDLAGDAMLEFPSLVFLLAALLAIRDLPSSGYPLRKGLWFALFASAAFWTKQHAVFLVLVPFALIAFTGRWRLLMGKTIWISSALIALAVYGNTLLSTPFHGTGVEQVPPAVEFFAVAEHNLRFYTAAFVSNVGVVPALLVGACILAGALLGLRKQTIPSGLPMFRAWACSAMALLLTIGPYEGRYLFYVHPALAVITYVALVRIGNALLRGKFAWVAPAGVALLCLVVGLRIPAPFLHGPSQAAALVVTGKPQRVLYCGSTDGNFIFAVRSLDGNLQTTVIPGEKLPHGSLTASGLKEFGRIHRIDRVVVERSAWNQACSELDIKSSSLHLEHSVPLSSSRPRWHGLLSIYRFSNGPVESDRTLKIPVPRIGAEIPVPR